MSESNLHAKSPAKLDPVTLMTNKLTRTELKEYKEAFEMLDSDEDGFLSTADIIMAIRGVGYNPNLVIRELLEDMSRESPDGVAKVDFEEFVRLVCLNVRYSYTAEDARADFEDGWYFNPNILLYPVFNLKTNLQLKWT